MIISVWCVLFRSFSPIALLTTARDLSYSPYSKFRVGCTVITEDGTKFCGANVENASYGACICAERATITNAVLNNHRSFKVIAISGDSEDPVTPCGICRQFIREFASLDVPIYMFSDTKFIRATLGDLLPMSFGPENLQ